MRMLRKYILKVTLCGLLLVGLAACSESPIETLSNGAFNGKSQIVLTFVTPNDNASTRADGMGTRSTEDDPDGYEDGIGYEDYINIAENDYRIYFFSYTSGDTNGGTLIAEFKPESMTQSSTTSTITYTVRGEVPTELLETTDFRVVMLANWGGWYPTNLTAGTTTIDDLVEGSNTTFYAEKKFVIDEDNLIPFYGVQEYTGVNFKEYEVTYLNTPLSLLRAVAKVEVILTPDESVDASGDANSNINEFSNVEIVNYNAQGYNAPTGVYVAADYDTNASKGPGTSDWPDEWVAGLHLVNGKNDSGSKTQDFTHVSSHTETANDTWRIYLPEYNNMEDDYCYIQVYVDGDPYIIYFADYSEGVTDNTNTSNRYNLKRNNLYRFYVTYYGGYLRVHVNKWENTYENDFTFDREIDTDNPDAEP